MLVALDDEHEQTLTDADLAVKRNLDNMLNLRKEHLKGKPRQIGDVDGTPVYEMTTTGGLWVITCKKSNGTLEPLAYAPHRAIGRHIAQKKEPNFKISDLSKGEDIPLESFAHLVPKYEELTDRMRALSGGQ